MKKIIIISALFFMALSSKAQQEPMLSQYMFNGMFINPGYTGSHKFWTSNLLHRSQWVNFEGSPKTFLLSVDGPISDQKMGLGAIISHETIGVTTQTDFYGNYAYHLPLGDGKLSFGLKAGLSNYSVEFNDLKYWDDNDVVYNEGSKSYLAPKFGFGTFYYSENWYAGISIPTLIASEPGKKFSLDINKSSNLRRHYLTTAGYVFDINENWKLKPSFLVKYLPNAPVQADINFSAMYNNMIWAGISYRTGDAVVGLVEYQASERFRIGYAYDMTITKIRNYSNGSHEIMIGYDFGKEQVKIKSPRFF